jgi:hypothetical protein
MEICLNVTYLVNGIWIAKAPAPVNVCLTNLLTRITATARGFSTSVARAAVAFPSSCNSFIKVRAKGCANVLDGLALRIQSRLDDVVRHITLLFTRNIHHIQAENYETWSARFNEKITCQHTITWHMRESDAHVDSQLLSSGLVNHYGCVHVDSPVIEKFDHHEGQYNSCRHQGH